jgi:quercetin dioxygenase-like cupin family protein
VKRIASLCIFLSFSGFSTAEQALLIKPLAEKSVSSLPRGELFWRIDNFGTQTQARAAMGAWSLLAESAGKIWLFTLGAPRAASSAGATKIAQVGPIPRVHASRYILRINDASGPPGSVTPVHSHPGTEAFFVLEGEQSIREVHGVTRIAAGQTAAGHGADEPMQVSSGGPADLHALVMLIVDADRAFTSPATLP